jgi:hypothetical protein
MTKLETSDLKTANLKTLNLRPAEAQPASRAPNAAGSNNKTPKKGASPLRPVIEFLKLLGRILARLAGVVTGFVTWRGRNGQARSTPRPQSQRMKAVSEWLVARNAYSGLVSNLLLAILLPIFWYAARGGAEYLSQSSHRVCVKIPQELRGMTFTLHNVAASGDPGRVGGQYEWDQPFNKPWFGNETCQTLRLEPHQTRHFRAYVTYEGRSFGEVKSMLERAGYLYVDDGRSFGRRQAWFVLPTEPIYEDRDSHLRDNIYRD